MTEKCCSSCKYWHYDRWTAEKYGMGVGVCSANGSPRFCDAHDCPFHSMED